MYCTFLSAGSNETPRISYEQNYSIKSQQNLRYDPNQRQILKQQQAVESDWAKRLEKADGIMTQLNAEISAVKNKNDIRFAYGLTSQRLEQYKEILNAPYISDMGRQSIQKNALDIKSSVYGSLNSSLHDIRKAEKKAKSQMLTKIGVGVVGVVAIILTAGGATPAVAPAVMGGESAAVAMTAAVGTTSTLSTIGTIGTYAGVANTALDVRNYQVLDRKGLNSFYREMKATSGVSKGLSVTSTVGSVANLYQSAGKLGGQIKEQGTKITELSKDSVNNATAIKNAKSFQTVLQVKQITTYTQMGVQVASIPQIINPQVYGKDYNRGTAGINAAVGITNLAYTGPAIAKPYYNQDKLLMSEVSVVPSKFAYTSFNPVTAVSIVADIKYATIGENLFGERAQLGANAIMQVGDKVYSTAQTYILKDGVYQASARADKRVKALMNNDTKSDEYAKQSVYGVYADVTNNPDPRTKMATKIKAYRSLENNTFLPMPIYQKFVNYNYSVIDMVKIEKPVEYNSIMFQAEQNKNSMYIPIQNISYPVSLK